MTDEMSRSSLAQRVDHLFKSVQPKGREYSYEEVARGCEQLTSGKFSKTYVWQLRTGQRDNPTKRHLEALAAFFGVPVAYFFDDAADRDAADRDASDRDVSDRIDSQLAFTRAFMDASIRDIALWALEMDGPARRSLWRIVSEISEMQNSRSATTPSAWI